MPVRTLGEKPSPGKRSDLHSSGAPDGEWARTYGTHLRWQVCLPVPDGRANADGGEQWSGHPVAPGACGQHLHNDILKRCGRRFPSTRTSLCVSPTVLVVYLYVSSSSICIGLSRARRTLRSIYVYE